MFQEFDGQIACGELTAQFTILLQVLLHILDTIFYLVAVVDMDMANGMLGELPLIDLDDGGEQFVNALSALEYRRHHRETQQFAQFVGIEKVTALFTLIKHVEGSHHAEVHVYELGGEIEIALKVAGVDDVEHDIRRLFHDLLTHVKFLGGIG